MINLIYFAAAVFFAACFRHPVFLSISYIAAFFYSVKLKGRKTFVFNLFLMIMILIYSFIYAYFNHFGVTDIGVTIIGNSITLESWVYGIVKGTAAASVLMIMNCFICVFSSDKIVYVFGRIVPVLSLFISIIFRSAAKTKIKIKKIELARQGIGKGAAQGNICEKIHNKTAIISAVVVSTAEDFIKEADSMKSRGYTLRGRSAFSIYRFDNRDRFAVLILCALIVTMFAALSLDQTNIYYNPEIIFNRITFVSYIFYAVYFFFLLFPLISQFNMKRIFKIRK